MAQSTNRMAAEIRATSTPFPPVPIRQFRRTQPVTSGGVGSLIGASPSRRLGADRPGDQETDDTGAQGHVAPGVEPEERHVLTGDGYRPHIRKGNIDGRNG